MDAPALKKAINAFLSEHGDDPAAASLRSAAARLGGGGEDKAPEGSDSKPNTPGRSFDKAGMEESNPAKSTLAKERARGMFMARKKKMRQGA